MANTTFENHVTVIENAWLQDVNDAVYGGKNISNISYTNVKALGVGAVGNGVTDDTAAFQIAADIGGAIYVPQGTYILTSVSMTKPCVWFGDGDLSILKRKANTDTSSPSVSTATMMKLAAHNIVVRLFDILLDGNEANQTGYELYGYLVRFSGLAGSSTSRLSLNIDNVTFKDATQACIAGDGDTATEGFEELNVTNCRFVNGRYGLPSGSPLTVSSSGYGPDYIVLTDKVYANILNNSFVFTNTLANGTFSRTAVRITFSTNTTNADGCRANIQGNYFYGCGRGERGTAYTVTGGTGTNAKFSVETLSGSGIATALLTEAGSGYTAADVLTLSGGAGGTVTVSTINSYGGVATFTVSAAGSGYTATQRPGNDVGIIDAYARGRELRISNNVFEGCQGVPIRGKTSCDMVYIAGNILDDCGKNPGINIGPNSYAEQTGRIIIHGNLINSAYGWAICVVGNSGATTGAPNTYNYVTDITISDNIVAAVEGWCLQQNPTLGEGIYCRSYRNLHVVNNTASNTAYRGIYLRGSTAGTPYYSENLIVSGNILQSTRASGVAVEASVRGPVIVSNNQVITASQPGFDIQAVNAETAILLYTNNVAKNTVNYGHYTRFFDSLTVTGNYVETVSGNSRGFYMQDAGTGKMTGNLVGAGVTTSLFGGGQSQNAIHDYHNSWNPKVLYGTAAPTTNAWTVGDVVWNTAPAAGGTLGWVCTTAGTPGTWKTFGGIAP